jgi:broad specificity phosphatase PhoE
MKIFMVRHGQTDSNAAKLIMGQRIDESLNDAGRKQVQELTMKIQDMTFDVIFSSPLKRAAETAAILASGRDTKVVLRDELKERDFGSVSGKSWADADALAVAEPGGLKTADRHLDYDYRPYGGESAEDVKKRLLRFIDEVKRDYSDRRVLVVAHGGILRFAHKLFHDADIDHIENAALEEFEV